MTITATTLLNTEFGNFKVSYHEHGNEFCVSFTYGDITKNDPIVRFQSSCLFGEAFHSTMCDCRQQLNEALELIKAHGNGVLVYSYKEGRGIGLKSKILSMEIERTHNVDAYEAFKILGLDKTDYRDYEAEVKALKEIGLAKKVRVFSQDSKKIEVLELAGYAIEKII